MIFIICGYLLILIGGSLYYLACVALKLLPADFEALQVISQCGAIGLVGGCLYCLRAVYINRCVHNNWSSDWYAWYFLRPIASLISGGVSFLFLKAGLLVLDSSRTSDSSEIGFFALAFVAGLNVDKFVAKIESVAQAIWGIEKSRASSDTVPIGQTKEK